MDTIYYIGLRKYLVHLPSGYNPAQAYPVVVALHGGGQHAESMVNLSLLNPACDDAGYIAVYPNGTGVLGMFTWNGGICCGYAMEHNVDDVAFFRKLVQNWSGKFNYDPKRIYVTGASNGAIMAYRLACGASDLIAGIAPVGGGLGVDGPAPSRRVPILHFHGLDDNHYPYYGGVGDASLGGANFLSVPDTIARFVNWYGLGEPVSIPDPDAQITSWPTPEGGPDPIKLYAVPGEGHQWPGGTPMPASANCGTYVPVPKASPLMLEWFGQWSL
jgi:polyhydroxybutyrate depolymerase